jgi:cell division transport system permease protein
MTGNRLAARGSPALAMNGSGRLLPLVVALLVYVAGLAGVGLLVIDDTQRASEHALAAALTLQVPAEASNARVETILALLRQTPGIVSVHLLEPAETARLLEPWLGSVPIDELPVPRLIDLRIDPTGKIDLAELRQKLASVVPDSRLDDHRRWPQEMNEAGRRIEGILAVGIATALLLVAASAAVAARTALMADRPVVELLHLLGAADAVIAGGLATRWLRLGLMGGVIGAIAALLTILALSGAGTIVQLPAQIAVNGAADWRVWGILAAIVPAAGLIAMASAWVVARRRLAEMP